MSPEGSSPFENAQDAIKDEAQKGPHSVAIGQGRPAAASVLFIEDLTTAVETVGCDMVTAMDLASGAILRQCRPRQGVM